MKFVKVELFKNLWNIYSLDNEKMYLTKQHLLIIRTLSRFTHMLFFIHGQSNIQFPLCYFIEPYFFLQTMGISNSKDRDYLKRKIKELKLAFEKERKQQEREKKQMEKEAKAREKEQKKQSKKKW